MQPLSVFLIILNCEELEMFRYRGCWLHCFSCCKSKTSYLANQSIDARWRWCCHYILLFSPTHKIVTELCYLHCYIHDYPLLYYRIISAWNISAADSCDGPIKYDFFFLNQFVFIFSSVKHFAPVSWPLFSKVRLWHSFAFRIFLHVVGFNPRLQFCLRALASPIGREASQKYDWLVRFPRNFK